MSYTDEINTKAGIRTKDIEGKKYTIKLLPATVGLKVGEKIIKACGPALGVLLDSGDSGGFDLYTDLSIAIVKQLDELDLIDTVKVLFADSYCGSQAIEFDTHFAGNYGELILLVEYALKENFGDFFIKYLKAKGLEIHTLREMMTKRVQSPEESEEKSND